MKRGSPDADVALHLAAFVPLASNAFVVTHLRGSSCPRACPDATTDA
jgi:hypothetical protein